MKDSYIPASAPQLPQKLLKAAPTEASVSLEISLASRKDDSSDDEDLCKRCRSLNIDEILSTRHEIPLGSLIMDLGPIKAPNFDLSCSFCRLLSSVEAATTERRTADNLLLYAYNSYGRFGPPNDDVVLLSVRQKFTELEPISHSLYSISSPSEEPHRTKLQATLVKPYNIDYSVIHKWITSCEQHHRGCKQERSLQSMPLRLIDCFTREIILGDITYQYVALSYVWGTANLELTVSSGEAQLLEEQFRTIEDAITVTRKLGVRYLWIDRYCINQLDAKEKHSQIRQMDEIYREAKITIIAAAGSDPTYGLPGVSRTPRVAQLHAVVGKHILASLMVEPTVLIQQSVWMSRGWTYQEALCSRRRLIFTDQYVYYECTEANWSEICDLKESFPLHNIFEGIVGSNPWKVINYISAYAERQLSYDSDALNGLLGIFRVLKEHPQSPVHHFWGIPVLPSLQMHTDGQAVYAQRTLTDRFIAGLCWDSLSPGRRRARFPSWSWTGWTCKLSTCAPEYENKENVMSNLNIGIQVFNRAQNSFVEFEAVLDDYKNDGSSSSESPILRVIGLAIDLYISHDDLYTRDDYICSLYARPFLERRIPEHMRRRVWVSVNEGIHESEANEKLLSQPIKGIILGDSTRLTHTHDIVLFILVVKRVRTKNGVDEYERVGSCRLGSDSSLLIECATRQSILLA